MPKPDSDMIRGTLDMLILKVISMEPMHGWGISERIQQLSDEALQVNQGFAVRVSAPTHAPGMDPLGVASNGEQPSRALLRPDPGG
jgi:hypothetical protein